MLDAIFSWETLRWFMWLVYFPVCVFLMVIVLLQKGKGTSFAGAFGIGPGSDAVFGPRASRSLPVRLTYISAGLFLVLALGLSAVEGKVGKGAAPQKVAIEEVGSIPESETLNELGLGSAYSGEETTSAPATSEGPGSPTPPAPVVSVEPKPAEEAAAPVVPLPAPTDVPGSASESNSEGES